MNSEKFKVKVLLQKKIKMMEENISNNTAIIIVSQMLPKHQGKYRIYQRLKLTSLQSQHVHLICMYRVVKTPH